MKNVKLLLMAKRCSPQDPLSSSSAGNAHLGESRISLGNCHNFSDVLIIAIVNFQWCV